MRAVWLEMRDEEPAAGGLADLLAAARVKAEAMQPRPSWWQRLLASLRRPPVLGLATAMVLLAGAALFGRRVLESPSRATDGAPPTATQVAAGSAARTEGTPAVGAARAEDAEKATVLQSAQREDASFRAARDESATGFEAPASTVRATGPQPESPELHEAHRAVRPPPASDAPSRVASAARPDGASVGDSGSRSAPGTGAAAETARAAAIVPQLGSSATAGKADDGRDAERARESARPADAVAAPAVVRSPAVSTSDAAAAGSGRSPAVSTSGAGSAAAPRRPASSATELSRLHRQCESAARRGDCAAVRKMVDRITQTDRSYRGRVAKDSPVAKCLAE